MEPVSKPVIIPEFNPKVTTLVQVTNIANNFMASHNESGKKGEQLAVDFIKKKGYKLVKSNWRYKHKEIDIIAYDRDKFLYICISS